MHLTRLILTNVGPHKYLNIKFDLGLIGVFGPNGSGKSTMVNYAYAALTNDFGRFKGVKKDNIYDLAAAGTESSIYVEGEHGEMKFTLYRGLRPEKHVLTVNTINNGNEITKANEIQRILDETLLNRKLIDRYVFVDQGDMFSFLSDTPGQRAATYQLLCGTEKAKVICDSISKLLEQDAELTAEVVDNSDEMRQRIAANTTARDASLGSRAEAAKKLLTPELAAKAERFKALRADWERLQTEKENAARQHATWAERLAAATTLFDERAVLVEELTSLVLQLQPDADQARATLASFKTYEDGQARRVRAQNHVNACKVGVENLPEEPKLEPDDADRDTLMETYHNEKAEWRRVTDILRNFDATGVVACPTCGTPVKDLTKHLADLRVIQNRSEQAYTKANLRVVAIDRQRKLNKNWETSCLEANGSLKSAEASLAAITAGSPPKGDKAALEQAVKDYNEQRTNLTSAEALLTEARQAQSTASARADAVQEQLQQMDVSIAASVVSDELLAKAKNALDRHTAARVAVAEIDARIKGYQSAIDVDNRQLEELTARLSRSVKARKFAGKLRRIKDEIMHPQALPQAVAQANLQDMEADINGMLDSFGSPFWVEAAEDLSFVVHFPGAPPRPAERLSGGQKSVLGMGFRASIGQLFNADIGLMCLDEPTAAMDRNNVGFLAEALTRYASEIRGKRQVIVISHAQELRPAFDQVVDLGVARE